MPSMVLEGLQRGKDKTFAVYRRNDGTIEKVSYKSILDQGDFLYCLLKSMGLKKGDRIASITSLCPYWFSLLYAALKGEFILTCIDPKIPLSQIKEMIEDTSSKLALTNVKNLHLDIPAFLLEEGFPQLNDIKFINDADSEEMPEDTFFILFSSGTTNERRKGVLLSHKTITLGIEYGMAKDSGVYKNTSAYTPRECDLMLFPPYHIAGLLCAVYDLYCNTTILMIERLSPNSLSTMISEYKPDNICTVPSMLTTLAKKTQSKLSVFKKAVISFCGFFRKHLGINLGKILHLSGHLKGLMIGASPCDKDTMEFFLNIGVDVALAYGLTELGAPLACTGKGYYPGTTGRVLRHTNDMDIRVSNKDEKDRGEIEIKSPYRMISYLNPNDNEGCFTPDGYFKTGDIGYFDKKNCLIICGRMKEAIVLSNGEKLLPEEIEKQYQNIDSVSEIAVFKVPMPSGCDSFSLAAVKDKSRGLPDESIKLKILDRVELLPTIYKPENVYILHELPLSSSHKVQRFRLTSMAQNNLLEPKTDDMDLMIDEDETVSKIRNMLISVDGTSWKNRVLSEGTLLNLDSLKLMDLYVKVEEEFKKDLFKLSKIPETFGELLDSIKNFDIADKNTKEELNLSDFPKKANKISKSFGLTLGRLARIRYKAKPIGLENIPKDTNFLICSNHITVVDPVWIYSMLSKEVREKTAVVGKVELLSDKVLGPIVSAQNFVPVDRTGNMAKTLTRCEELLNAGWNILIFPEGTNFENAKEMLTFKEGPARLSIITSKPIVPVHIKGVKLVNTDSKRFLPPVSDKVEVVFGKIIYPNTIDPKELNVILRKEIEKL